MRDDTKLARIRDAMRTGDWDEAIRLAGQFRRLGKQATRIRRAAEAALRPEFYRELGRDLDEIRREGIEAIKERFSSSWDSVKDEDSDSD